MTGSAIGRGRSATSGSTASARVRPYGLAGALCMLLTTAPEAATFSAVDFDSARNELIVTMTYDGSNPDHHFSVQWGTCRKLGNEGNHQIVATLLDDQWEDTAQQAFTTIVHVSLAGVNCHPALVTLRTAPKYEYNVQIP